MELARSDRYDAIVAAALVVDGGIYRHDFVAQAVVDGLMRVGLDSGTPVLSVSLTPHHFQETDHHRDIFMVEIGTSSYYSSLAEAAEEPVLKEICQHIAADELRHYKLFYTHLKRYLDKERIGRLRRFLIAASRFKETEDDELSYAFYAANSPEGTDYDRRYYNRAYINRAFRYYSRKQCQRAMEPKETVKVTATLTEFFRGHLRKNYPYS